MSLSDTDRVFIANLRPIVEGIINRCPPGDFAEQADWIADLIRPRLDNLNDGVQLSAVAIAMIMEARG